MHQRSGPGRVATIFSGQPIALILLSFGTGTLSSPVRALLAVYVEAALHQPPAFTAALLTVQLAINGIFALVGGILADSLGQRRAYLLGLVGGPLTATLFLCRSLPLLVLVVIGLGITGGLLTVGGGAYLMASATRTRLAQSTALFFFGSTLGGALGTLIIGPAADRWGFTRVGAADLTLAVLLLIGAVFLLPEAPTGVRPTAGSLGGVLASYVHVLRQRPVALLGSLRYCTTCLYGAVSLAVPLLIYRLSGSVTVASLYATTALAAATLFQYAMGQVIDRRGTALPLRILSIAVPLLAALLSVAVHTLAPLFLLGVCANCVLWALSTAMPSLVRVVASGATQGRTYGANEMLWSAGMLTGTLLGGALLNAHPRLLFGVLALANLWSIAAAAALITWLGAQPGRS